MTDKANINSRQFSIDEVIDFTKQLLPWDGDAITRGVVNFAIIRFLVAYKYMPIDTLEKFKEEQNNKESTSE